MHVKWRIRGLKIMPKSVQGCCSWVYRKIYWKLNNDDKNDNVKQLKHSTWITDRFSKT